MKTVITSGSGSLKEYLEKTWKHRSFVLILAKRDLKIKYAQTALGIGWTVIQPLVAMLVFTLFFSLLLDVKTEYPYVLFVLSGLLCWNLLNYIFSQGSMSLINNQDLIRKVSFPKLILPMSKVLVALVEFGISAVPLVVMMVWYGMPVLPSMLIIPFVLVFIVAFSLGVSLILAASTLRFRDLHHIIPFLINFGIWFTPVFYPVSLIPEKYSHLLYLNPMACFLAMFRWALFGEHLDPQAMWGLLTAIIFLIIGVGYFRRVDDRITDTI